jgi:hypothetical protein
MKIKKGIFAGMAALALLFGLVLSGCLSTGNPHQNNIGEIIGDDFALVRAPASEVANGTGMEMVIFDGNDLTIWNKYKITRPFMGMGDATIDLKVTPGNHEFTIIWRYGDETKITTLSYDFKAGKWYDFKSQFLLGAYAPIAMREGTLEAGKPKGSADEVTTFQIDQIYNSDEVAPEPQQASFRGNPGDVTADMVVITLTDGTQPGQVVLTLSNGFKFGPDATAANMVKYWMTYPTYPITVSPAHCTGDFSSDGTRVVITMKTSSNKTVTSGYVGFKDSKVWNGQYFIPDPLQRLGPGFHNVKLNDFVVGGGRFPTLD